MKIRNPIPFILRFKHTAGVNLHATLKTLNIILLCREKGFPRMDCDHCSSRKMFRSTCIVHVTLSNGQATGVLSTAHVVGDVPCLMVRPLDPHFAWLHPVSSSNSHPRGELSKMVGLYSHLIPDFKETRGSRFEALGH